jgi:hypothetical protein
MIHLPATTKKGGDCVGGPDVCKTPSPAGPPIPVPYPSLAACSGASDTCKKVLVTNKESVNDKSRIKSSMGDEAGTLKGVVSNTHCGEVQFKKASSNVYVQNRKFVHHLALTAHNGSNANAPIGSQVSPSQTKVLVKM